VKTGRHHIKVALVLTLVTALASVPLTAQQPKPRIERDLLGEKEIPGDAYYGVQTARAKENFQISGIPINHYPGFIEAWAIVKLAAQIKDLLDPVKLTNLDKRKYLFALDVCKLLGRFTSQVNWYLSQNLRLEFNYGYGRLNRFDLKGNTQFLQSRFQFYF